MLQVYFKGRCHLQEDTSTFEAIHTTIKKIEDKQSLLQSSDRWTFKSDHKKFSTVDNQVQYYSRPKMDIKPQLSLICKGLCKNFYNKLDLVC